MVRSASKVMAVPAAHAREKRALAWCGLAAMIAFGAGSGSCQAASLAEKWQVPSEDVTFQGVEKRFGRRPVPAELHFPKNATGKLPLIITQHGSSRDGGKILNGQGRTDELSARLIKQGTDAGFAVAVLDAFEGTGIRPRDKKKFPQAHRYVAQLRAKLAAHPRIDATNMFLTGFSFGGGTVLKHLDARYIGDVPGWRAVAAAEPGCGMFSEPVAISFPVLIVKGGESHYPPAPCMLYRDLLRAAGTRVSYLLIPTANHFFSENGRIVEGVAVNGCSDNPVIRAPNGKLRFADGTPTDRATVMRKCITNRAGAGRSREHLDFAIQKIIDFFQAARRAGGAS